MDQTLLTSLRQRDPAALATVFEMYADRLYHLAVSILQDEQQADGVVQDSFVALIEHIDSFEGRSQISTWLYRVAYNNCMQRLRRLKPDVDIDGGDTAVIMPERFIDWQAAPEVLLSSDEIMYQVARAIETLSPSLKAVFILRDVDELSTDDTAKILDISAGAVKVRLHRARLALREALASYFEEVV